MRLLGAGQVAPAMVRIQSSRSHPTWGRQASNLRLKKAIRSRRVCSVAASGRNERSASDLGSDAAFLAKLAVGSAIGAASVKYGSLVTDALFSPSAVAATALVVTPVVVYAGVLLVRGQRDSNAV